MVISIVMAVVVGLLIVALNVWDFRRRRAMTPAERAADDEEARRELAIW